MKTLTEILGREPKPTEKMLYDLYKDNSNYIFEKDKHGNLIAKLK